MEEATKDKDPNTSRLLASGVSVTVVDKAKKAEAEKEAGEKVSETASTEKSSKEADIGLSSDISVTVVHKKKEDGSAATATAASGPKISVKKESELLQDPSSKDIVEVSAKIRGKPAPPFPARKSVDEDKSSSRSPPDPIVTISKVQSLATGATAPPPAPIQPHRDNAASLLKKSHPGVATSPRTNTSSPQAVTVAGGRSSAGPTPTSAAVSANALANLLGQPRPLPGSTPPGGASRPPHFRGPPGLPPAMRPPTSSAMLGLGYRPPSAASAMGMPSLHPRPSGPLSTPPSAVPPSAGPVNEQLTKVAGKLVDFMRGTLEDLFRELSAQGSPEATIKALQIEMEKMQWRHQQELQEVKHNADLIIVELRQSMEAEKQKYINDFKKQAEIERQKAIAETKKKQWCANCGKEAIFYCCWNTSYCDYPCQVRMILILDHQR